MGAMDDVVLSDAAIFDNADLMPGVESVVLTFQNGTTRTVTAQVFRGEPVAFGDGYRPGILISFANSATTGLKDTEIDGGGVITVTLGKNYGETPRAIQLHRSTDPGKQSDAGRVWVEVG